MVGQTPPPPLSERTNFPDNPESALRIAEKLTEKSGRSRDGQAQEIERLRQLVQGAGGVELVANFIRQLRKIALIVISIIIGITVLGSIFSTDTSVPSDAASVD